MHIRKQTDLEASHPPDRESESDVHPIPKRNWCFTKSGKIMILLIAAGVIILLVGGVYLYCRKTSQPETSTMLYQWPYRARSGGNMHILEAGKHKLGHKPYTFVSPDRQVFLDKIVERVSSDLIQKFAGKNPKANVAHTNFAPPLLEDGEGDGKTVLSQDCAIAIYLGEKFDMLPGPTGSQKNAIARQYVMDYNDLFGLFHGTSPVWGLDAQLIVNFLLGDRCRIWFATIEEQIRGPFHFGETPCYTDYYLYGMLEAFEVMYAECFKLPNPFPNPMGKKALALKQALAQKIMAAGYQRTQQPKAGGKDGETEDLPVWDTKFVVSKKLAKEARKVWKAKSDPESGCPECR